MPTRSTGETAPPNNPTLPGCPHEISLRIRVIPGTVTVGSTQELADAVGRAVNGRWARMLGRLMQLEVTEARYVRAQPSRPGRRTDCGA